MRTYMIYLLLTGKRLLRQLPYFLAGLAVMVLLVLWRRHHRKKAAEPTARVRDKVKR